jgi:CMP-N-acetylneuraminic acid synthetase
MLKSLNQKHSVLSIIPARGGSKGILKKNIIDIQGAPLISYTIIESLKSALITRTIVSTDSSEIAAISLEYGAEVPFLRPIELAADDTPALPVIQHAVNYMASEKKFNPDIIILLQPTSPLRTAKHIDEALQKLIDSEADSIVSVTKLPHNYNPTSLMQLQGQFLVPYLDSLYETSQLRQKKPIFYARNGAAIYAFTFNCLTNKKSIYGDKIVPYEMRKEESIDIDDFFDLEIASYLLSKRPMQ